MSEACCAEQIRPPLAECDGALKFTYFNIASNRHRRGLELLSNPPPTSRMVKGKAPGFSALRWPTTRPSETPSLLPRTGGDEPAPTEGNAVRTRRVPGPNPSLNRTAGVPLPGRQRDRFLCDQVQQGTCALPVAIRIATEYAKPLHTIDTHRQAAQCRARQALTTNVDQARE